MDKIQLNRGITSPTNLTSGELYVQLNNQSLWCGQNDDGSNPFQIKTKLAVTDIYTENNYKVKLSRVVTGLRNSETENQTLVDYSDGSIGYITITASSTVKRAENADSADKLNSNAGSNTQPIYFSKGKPNVITANKGGVDTPVYFNNGVITECSKYASGTQVYLNGSKKNGKTATIYAAENQGQFGQILMSQGGEVGSPPYWVNISDVPINDKYTKIDFTATKSQRLDLPNGTYVFRYYNDLWNDDTLYTDIINVDFSKTTYCISNGVIRTNKTLNITYKYVFHITKQSGDPLVRMYRIKLDDKESNLQAIEGTTTVVGIKKIG